MNNGLSLRENIFKVIEAAGSMGATCAEIENVTGILHQTAGGRINELVKANRVRHNGLFRRANTNPKSKAGKVWVMCAPGERDSGIEAQKINKDKKLRIPTSAKAFWMDIRARVQLFATKTAGHIERSSLEQASRNLEADLKVACARFNTYVGAAVTTTAVIVTELSLKEACEVLSVDWPPKEAQVKRHYRSHAREYHPDVSGTEATRERFEIATAAYDLLTQHFQKQKNGDSNG